MAEKSISARRNYIDDLNMKELRSWQKCNQGISTKQNDAVKITSLHEFFSSDHFTSLDNGFSLVPNYGTYTGAQ